MSLYERIREELEHAIEGNRGCCNGPQCKGQPFEGLPNSNAYPIYREFRFRELCYAVERLQEQVIALQARLAEAEANKQEPRQAAVILPASSALGYAEVHRRS